MSVSAPRKQPSRFGHVILGGKLPMAVRITLFIAFTVLLVAVTVMLLPRLVVLGPWGYVAGCIVSILSSATVVIPSPGHVAVLLMAKELNPFLLGLAVGLGGTLGELTGYWLGTQGREPLEASRFHAFVLKAMNKFGGGFLIVFSLIPLLPVDAAGVMAGAVRYPVPKFLLYLAIGKTIKFVALLWLAAQAFAWAEPYLRWLG